ncbi:oligosaccharide flippase family protein [Vibrio campbellii]|uniref:oligosaccharide flippase family protein n=1 Tax=Vibrio campbellii TaxID=680 RepID=UPI00385730D7
MSNLLYKAIFKSVTGKFSTYIVQFFSLAIFARMFTPEEFGVIASIQVFVIFFQMISSVGIGPAIINEDFFSEERRDGVFSVTIIFGFILSLTFYFFSFALNYFYSGVDYQTIAIWVSISIFFNSISIVPTTALNKDAMFIRIAITDIVAEIASIIIVCLLYISGVGLLALAIRATSLSIIKFVLVILLSKKTDLGAPKIGKELFHIFSILKFSLYQFGFSSINYFSKNLDNILIAKYFGMSTYGIYDKSYQLMRYPLLVTTFALTPAIQPVLTKVRNNVNKIVLEHNNLVMKILSLSLLISFFIYQNSDVIVLVIFGSQWDKVVPLVEIFSFMIPVQAIMSSSAPFFQVMNKPKQLFITGCVLALVNTSFIVYSVFLGDLFYVAKCIVVSAYVSFIITYFMLFRFCFRLGFFSFNIKILKSIISVSPSITLYVTLSYILENKFNISSEIINFIVNFFVFMISILVFYFPIKKVNFSN